MHLNFPPESICNSEKPWGCDYEDLKVLRTKLRDAGIQIEPSRAGDTYVRYGDVELSSLVAHDGQSPPIGRTDINDLSVIILLRNGATRALFTGDLNRHLGEYLAKSEDPRLKAALLKVPHHGTEGLAPNSFFSLVSPGAAFVPAPLSLWLSDRSKRPREWFESSNIPTYVSGRDGAVTVDIRSNGYSAEIFKSEPFQRH